MKDTSFKRVLRLSPPERRRFCVAKPATIPQERKLSQGESTIINIMRKFDTKVQHLKYKVLREVARLAWEDKLMENMMDIPKKLSPGKQPTIRSH